MIVEAIKAINPNAVFEVGNDSIDEITWLEGTVPIDKSTIEAKLAELQAEYDAKQYQRDRQQEYPSIQECIHAILDDDLEALQAKRTAVKAKYPKPE